MGIGGAGFDSAELSQLARVMPIEPELSFMFFISIVRPISLLGVKNGTESRKRCGYNHF